MKPDTSVVAPSARRWLTTNVLGFSLASFFSDLGHELITSLLPGFLLTLGAPPIALGLIEGISNPGQSFGELFGGAKADSVRDRAPWVYAGYAATALKALIALVTVWPLIIVIRTVAWFGRGIRGPMRDSMIADDANRENWGKAYGFREALDTAGALTGPVLAFLLLSHLHYRLLIGLTAIPALITIVVIVAMVREVPHRLHRPSERLAFRAPYPHPFRRFVAGATLFAVGYVAPTFFILRTIQLQSGNRSALTASTLAIGFYAIHNFVYAAGSFPSGWLADRLSPRYLVLLGYLVWAIPVAGFALGPTNLLLLGSFFAVSGIATALIETSQTTWTAQLLPQQIRGRGLGLLAGLVGFGQLGSGIITGLVWTAFSARPAFLLAGVAALGGLAITSTVSMSREL